MLAGWITVLAAVVMLSSATSTMTFVLLALGIEVLGFVLAARAHIASRQPARDA